MPLQSTSGAASYDAFGGGVAAVPKYIEDYFSTFLYQGTSASNTINNGIDLSTKGGLVWIKQRNQATSHRLFDTVRGVQNSLASNSTAATASFSGYLTAFNTNGFTVGSANDVNESGFPLTSWSWAKAPKFFDVVTYTGTGSVQNIAHSLGSTPGCIFIKCTSSADYWIVYHRGLTNPEQSALYLNDTSGQFSGSVIWNNTLPTSTQFTIGTYSRLNTSGATYVAYLFAHDAGGFGLTGTDNVISCGSYTGNALSDGPTITLGFEPQWILVKDSSFAANWQIVDTMRGLTVESDNVLRPNTTAAEYAQNLFSPTATGFKVTTTSSDVNREFSTYIYIAIRRGPMKVPTSGTSVFSVDYQGQYTPKPPGHTSGFVTDMALVRNKNTTNDMINVSRLTGDNYLITSSTAAAGSLSFIDFDYMNGWGDLSTTDANYYSWMFRRAPSFFDEVCYTGNGSTQTIAHNLGVVPELIIAKNRGQAGNNWPVLFNFASTTMNYGFLNLTNSCPNDTYANVGVFSAAPTSTSMFLTNSSSMNASGYGIVAYLFATCAGVSKVGSYTGTGTTKQVDCGFTGGARFVLIKRTDSTGDWYVWDSARGIVAGNDPYLLLNSTAAEVTSTDYIDTYSAGFEISSTAPAAINASGGTFIFLAIA